jgi:hypothetical protein
MPAKIPAQLPVVPARSRTLLEEPGALARFLNLVMDAFRGRGITELDVAGSLALQEYQTYTIAAGVIDLTITGRGGQDTATPSAFTVDTESAAAADDLDTINGGRDGQLAIIRAVNDDRTVVLKDATGNLYLGRDVALDSNNKFALLVYVSSLSRWIGEGGTGVGACHFEPLTNGDPVNPELVFDANGDIVMIEVCS